LYSYKEEDINHERADDIDGIEFISLNFDADEIVGDNIHENYANQISINQFISEARKEAKPHKCYYCGQKTIGFCNSHSIPAFCLRNIALNGKVYYANNFINIPGCDTQGGINKTGTFHLLCRKCDSIIFQEYENPKNYEKIPTSIMLSQIAMKNHLKNIAKRRVENILYKKMKKNFPHFNDLCDYHIRGTELDLEEYTNDYRKAKSANIKKNLNSFEIIYFNKLNYVIPFAFQSGLNLMYDFNGNIINNIYNMSSHCHLKEIHVCALPFKDFSIIMMFIDASIKRYINFYKQLLTFPQDTQLAIINYIIFLYSEDFYMSPNVSKKILEDKEFKRVVGQLTFAISDSPIQSSAIVAAKSTFDLNHWDHIPNLLDKTYAIV